MDELLEQLRRLPPEKREQILQKLARRQPAESAIPRVARQPRMPLSFAQQRLWFLCQFEGQSLAYNIPGVLRLDGPLHREALEQCVNTIVQRHEALRTSFLLEEDAPVQVIAPELTVPLPVVDLQGLAGAAQGDEVQRLATQEARTPFSLERPPLLRLTLLRLAPERHVLLLTFHHIVFDGWSIHLFVRELTQLYAASMTGAPAALQELAIQYVDFACWQREWLRGEKQETQLAYWKKQLAGAPAQVALPTDRPRPPVQSFRGDAVAFHLGRRLTQQLKAVGEKTGATLFMVLLGAFAGLLHRYRAGEDLVVGTPIANRGRRELESLIGFFVNTLALRIDLSGDPSFLQLVERVRRVTLDAYTHQDLPFERLVEELHPERNLSSNPVVQVLFALQNTPAGQVELPGLIVTPLEMPAVSAKFDLTLLMEETAEGLRGWLEFSSDLFEPATLRRMAAHYENLLAGIVADATQPLSALPLLTREEEQQVVEEWNRTAVEYPELDCLHSLIEAQVRRTPEATALIFEGDSLTYRQLDERANQLAWHLLSLGVGPEQPVALCLERSLELVIALLGVLKAGAAYVPLDPSYPPERLAFMLSDCAASVLLTQRSLASSLPASSSLQLFLEEAAPVLALQPSHCPALALSADSLAYVIYTSGSTGQPKGAMNSHRAVANRLLWMQHSYPLGSDDCVLQKTPFSFDVSVWEFFWPLLSGARLVLARPGGHQDSSYLAHLIHQQRVTTLHFVPSMLRAFLEHPDLSGCSCLRRVFCSGEGLPAEVQLRFSSRLSAQLHNLYGPTEAAIDVTAWHCALPSPTPIVPLGRPVANTQVYVLDSHLRPVPLGVPGELFLAGVQLARGYLRRPALTAERFIPDPFSPIPGSRLYRTGDLARWLPGGVLEFLGRIDDQIKLRGLRIELGEIEAVLSLHPAVSQCVVLARTASPDRLQLVAYAVPSQEQAHPLLRRVRWQKEGRLDETTLRELPNGMVVTHLNPGETDFLYDEIFHQRGYLRHGLTLRDGDCVFDVGANIGLFTLFAAQQARNIRVFAFEPIPRIFEKLRTNLALHGVEAIPIEAGLSREQGRATFTYYPHVSIVSGRFADAGEERAVVAAYLQGQQSTSPGTTPGEAGVLEELLTSRLQGEQVECQLQTVSAVIREHGVERIDLLKVDVEKSEADVLAGIAAEDWPRIRQVVVEVHDKEGRLEQLTQLLRQQGFELVIEQEEGLQNSGLYGIWARRPEAADESRQAPEQHAPLPWSSPRLWGEELRQALLRKLPDYMVPEFFVPLDALPLSPAGKLDRRALPAPDLSSLRQGRELVLPRTPDEQLIASIWQELLGIAQVGVDESFFRLGGHSLLATQVLSRLRDALQLELPLQLLFDAPTVATLAQALAALRQSAASQPSPTAIPRLSRERHRAKSLPPNKPGT